MTDSPRLEHVLVVFCHPRHESLGHRLLAEYTRGLAESGRTFEIADLYAEKFDPVFTAEDYCQFEGGTLPASILAEQARVERADAIVIISPLWWLGFPATLKGWFDRVWANGWAYKFANDPEGSLLSPRPYLLMLTTGGSAGSFARHRYAESLDVLVREGLLGWCGVSESALLLLHDSGFDDDTTQAHIEFARLVGAGPIVATTAAPPSHHVTVLRSQTATRYRTDDSSMDAATAIRRICDAWIARDNDAIADLFADDGVFVDPLHARPLVGRDDIRTTNQPAVDELMDISVELHHVLGSGDRAFAEGRMKATVIADKSVMDFAFAMVAETADGRLVRLAEYFDTARLA